MDAGLLQLAGLVDAEASLDVMPALRYMLLKIDGTGRAVEGLAYSYSRTVLSVLESKHVRGSLLLVPPTLRLFTADLDLDERRACGCRVLSPGLPYTHMHRRRSRRRPRIFKAESTPTTDRTETETD